MYPFIETIHIEHHKVFLLENHLSRIQQTCVEYYGKKKDIQQLHYEILFFAKETKIKTKLSIYYNLHEHSFFHKYYKIKNFHLIENNEYDYHLKYADRSFFEQAKSKFDNADEIIIVKNGKITDTSFSNICLLKNNKWITPITPLLNGIKRQYYLQQKQIEEQEIKVKDIKSFSKISLINSLLDLTKSQYDIETINF